MTTLPTESQLSRTLDVGLHIGSGKTGTSSVQHFMHRNRERLADLGHLYPRSPGLTRHVRLGLYIKPDDALVDSRRWQQGNFPAPEVFRRNLRRRLYNEINRSGLPRVLFSDEALYGSPDRELQRLGELVATMARSLRLVVYLRRQDDHLVSRYQQVVKTGETKRLEERTQRLNLTKTYDYYARLRTWQRLLQPDEFVVRRFERDRFVDGSLFQDFLDAFGIEVRADDLEGVPSFNESLDAESVELLRILNLLCAENETAASLVTVDRPMINVLADASTGPTLTLRTRLLDEFMATWEESNRQVATEFLGDASGQLFRTPRKTRNTTAEQHLDPARLDHFLALLDLPEQVHAPLRRLVEREARTG